MAKNEGNTYRAEFARVELGKNVPIANLRQQLTKLLRYMAKAEGQRSCRISFQKALSPFLLLSSSMTTSCHLLDTSSSGRCADITKKFEQRVARDLWGNARIAFGAPSRRKRERKKTLLMPDPNGRNRDLTVRAADYPGGFVFYKMERAGLLQGLADRRPRPDITRWHRIAQHLPDRARVDPKTTSRFALAQTLNHYRVANPPIQFHSLHPPPFAPKCKGLSLTEFCSGATRLSGRFSEGLLLRRSHLLV